MLNQPNVEYKWLANVKQILSSIGRSDLWLNQEQNTCRTISKHVKQTLTDQYKQTWSSQLQESNKGRIYSSYKDSHHFENYFKILDSKDVLTIFKFRTANFKLPVERPRYEAIPYEDRICKLCTQNQVGSESHYMFDCVFFKTHREHYFNSAEVNDRNNLSLRYHLNSENKHLLKNLCKFHRTIMDKFS